LHRKGLQALIIYDFGIKRLQVGDYFKNKGIKKINNIKNGPQRQSNSQRM
jgi:hypothetical protein